MGFWEKYDEPGTGCFIKAALFILLFFGFFCGNAFLLSGEDEYPALVFIAIICDIVIAGFIIYCIWKPRSEKRAEKQKGKEAQEAFKQHINNLPKIDTPYHAREIESGICAVIHNFQETETKIAQIRSKIAGIHEGVGKPFLMSKKRYIQNRKPYLDNLNDRLKRIYAMPKEQYRLDCETTAEFDRLCANTITWQKSGELLDAQTKEKLTDISTVRHPDKDYALIESKIAPVVFNFTEHTICIYPSVILSFDYYGAFEGAFHPKCIHMSYGKYEHKYEITRFQKQAARLPQSFRHDPKMCDACNWPLYSPIRDSRILSESAQNKWNDLLKGYFTEYTYILEYGIQVITICNYHSSVLVSCPDNCKQLVEAIDKYSSTVVYYNRTEILWNLVKLCLSKDDLHTIEKISQMITKHYAEEPYERT